MFLGLDDEGSSNETDRVPVVAGATMTINVDSDEDVNVGPKNVEHDDTDDGYGQCNGGGAMSIGSKD